MTIHHHSTAIKAVWAHGTPHAPDPIPFAIRYIQRRFDVSASLAGTIAELAMIGGRR